MSSRAIARWPSSSVRSTGKRALKSPRATRRAVFSSRLIRCESMRDTSSPSSAANSTASPPATRTRLRMRPTVSATSLSGDEKTATRTRPPRRSRIAASAMRPPWPDSVAVTTRLAADAETATAKSRSGSRTWPAESAIGMA